MDGTNIADISDKAPSSLSGVLLGVDTVQEFSVQTHGYSAEFGRAAGGIMSAVTKSGTNQIHGTVFEFHRDSSLDSRNFFDQGELPDFRRNQFGGTVGGPMVKNRLFYFGSLRGAARAPRRDAVRPAAQRARASGHRAERAGTARQRRRPSDRAAVSRSAVSDSDGPRLWRRHRGDGARPPGSDRRGLRRREVRLQPGHAGQPDGALVARRVRHARSRSRIRSSSKTVGTDTRYFTIAVSTSLQLATC